MPTFTVNGRKIPPTFTTEHRSEVCGVDARVFVKEVSAAQRVLSAGGDVKGGYVSDTHPVYTRATLSASTLSVRRPSNSPAGLAIAYIPKLHLLRLAVVLWICCTTRQAAEEIDNKLQNEI